MAALCEEIRLRGRDGGGTQEAGEGSGAKTGFGLSVAPGATVYFGGGTPTLLTPGQIGRIVETLRENGFWQNPAEATIEANPGTVDHEALRALRQLGFDRISLGVQSLQDNELKRLGRVHSAAQALDAVQAAREAGFTRINVDLMYGIPGQTPESYRDTLQKILRLGLSHVSAYSLILEEGTPLYRLAENGQADLPEEEAVFAMYCLTEELLPQQGLRRYEVSNYSAPGQESLHNEVYWHYEPYAAFGAGACAFTGGRRLTNPAGVAAYMNAIGLRKASREAVAGCRLLTQAFSSVLPSKENAWPHGDSCPERSVFSGRPELGCADAGAAIEDLTPALQLEEAMIMGLRLMEGVHLPTVRQRFQVDPLERWRQELLPFFEKKMLERKGEFLRLTSCGMRLGNEVFEAFIP